jgi:DNA ligase-1
MELINVAKTSKQVAETRSRLKKIEYLTHCIGDLAADEIEIGVSYLEGRLLQGRIGIGPSVVRAVFPIEAAEHATLTLTEVNMAFERIARNAGAGSTTARKRQLAELFSRAIREEQDFLALLALGELRQGALEGILVEAIARAANVAASEVRRAVMLAGETGVVAKAALTDGRQGLQRFSLQVLNPVKPMLAQTAENIDQALLQLGNAELEYKLDGVRVQVHKAGNDVVVFTRHLHDVTAVVPELVETVKRIPADQLILDGETLALAADGRPHPFQITMRRFGRKLDIARMREELPLSAFFFDCLHLQGEDLIDRPAVERFARLENTLPPQLVIPRLVTNDPDKSAAFLDEAMRRGHEGVMAKALDAPYEAGNRGSSWLKVKPVYTLDLVVLAAEWGYGRRQGWLSNLHLGARDPASGQFVMLGKTFKGMTDKMLTWQTRKLQELKIAEDGHTVHVRPELVVEVVFNDIQASPQFPGGLALRFARIKRYRQDKPATEADTIDTVRAIYAGQRGK